MENVTEQLQPTALPEVYPRLSVKSYEIEKIPTLEQRRSRRVSTVSSFFNRFSTTLPPKRHTRWVRHARHTIFNVYRRLFSLVFILNLIGLWIFVARLLDNGVDEEAFEQYSKTALANLANAAAANIMVAILIRQDYIINMLFR